MGEASGLNPASPEYGSVSGASQRKWRATAFACFVAGAVIAEGYDIGVLNGALVRIREDLGLNTWSTSVVVTVTPLFIIFGAFGGGALSDHFGRRFALAVTCLILAVGPVLMALSHGIALLLATRCIVGFGMGMGFLVVAAYISELSPTDERGQLNALQDIFLNVGILFGFVMNWLLLGIPNDWRWMIAAGGVPAFVLLLGVGVLPESPRWLVLQNRKDEAREILEKYVPAAEVTAALSGPVEELATWQDLTTQDLRRRLVSALIIGAAQCCCGMFAISTYSSLILSDRLGDEDAFTATLGMGVVKLLVIFVAVALLERVGRRPMLLISIFVQAASCVWLAVGFGRRWDPILLVAGFWTFMAGVSIGTGPVTFVYITEVFPNRHRAKGVALCLCVSRCCNICIMFSYPLLNESIGSAWLFTLQAIICFGFFAMAYTFTVETSGIALENMSAAFKSK